MEKKKISKEKVDSYINKIREEGKAREKRYQDKYKKSEELNKRLQVEKIRNINRSESLAAQREKIENERKNLITNRIKAMQNNSIFPSYSYGKQQEKLQDISKRERFSGINAKKLIQLQKKEINKQRFNKAMSVASKVETRVDVGLERAYQKLGSLAKQKVVSRQVLKKNSMVVNVPNFVAPSILGDENRFFKGEMNKEKRSLFFS